MTEETQECNICIEKYTQQTRKKVICPSCNYECCSVCYKQFILNDTTQQAHCMNCNVAFTNDFLNLNFSKTWNNGEYRNHRTQLLFQEQKSHLPDTESYVQDLNAADVLLEQAKQKRSNIKDINDSYTNKVTVYHERIQELTDMIQSAQSEIRKLNRECGKTTRPLFKEAGEWEKQAYDLINGTSHKEKEKRSFLMNCCVDGCKGFINNKYKCGLCDAVVCSKCHQIKDENHECNEDDVKTVEEIKKSCKNCPKCGIPTQKISGCPQMWCVECHAVWNWNTGELDKSGRVHNPHYYHYLRNGDTNSIRREMGDVLCGGDVDGIELRQAFHFDGQGYILALSYEILQNVNHVADHEMRRFQEAGFQELRSLRVAYLKNHIDESQWVSELKKYERRERKKKDYRDVLGLYVASIQDLLRNSVDRRHLYVHEMIQMKDYTNSVLDKLNTQYNIKGFQLEYINVTHNMYATHLNITHI